jgi:hypothetical protein
MTDQIASAQTLESVAFTANELCAPPSTSHVSSDPISGELNTFARQWQSRLVTGIQTGSASGSNQPDSGTSSSTSLRSHRKPSSVISPRELIVGLKKWIGVVQGVEGGMFTAELSPIDHEGPALLADFDLELLAPDDNVQAGDVVYLTSRYVRAARGYSTATTQVRLRRPGLWTQDEVTEIQESARDEAQQFNQYVD